MFLLKLLISLAIVGAGIYVLTHVKKMATLLQSLYVCQAERAQEKKSLGSNLFMYNPQTWQIPFTIFMFKAGVILFGIWLLLKVYPIIFGPITL